MGLFAKKGKKAKSSKNGARVYKKQQYFQMLVVADARAIL